MHVGVPFMQTSIHKSIYHHYISVYLQHLFSHQPSIAINIDLPLCYTPMYDRSTKDVHRHRHQRPTSPKNGERQLFGEINTDGATWFLHFQLYGRIYNILYTHTHTHYIILNVYIYIYIYVHLHWMYLFSVYIYAYCTHCMSHCRKYLYFFEFRLVVWLDTSSIKLVDPLWMRLAVAPHHFPC